MEKIIAIITGDIINSRAIENQSDWIKPLKKNLGTYGKTPKKWEIFRGDSFQVELDAPENSLWAAIYIKALMRSIKGLDVRMAIGIGAKNFDTARISESNGEAFVNSGEQFESLRKMKRNLAVKTPWPEVDKELNLMISLASIAMDRWTTSSAELVAIGLVNENLSQKQLGKKIGRNQSSISERQSRGYYTEIMALEAFYRNRILQQLKRK